MVDLMRKGHPEWLSAEGRVKNTYEGLYFRVFSGDHEMEDLLRDHIPEAFRQRNRLVSDGLEDKHYKQIFLDAYQKSAQAVQKDDLSPMQIQKLSDDLDAFVEDNPRFFTTTVDSITRLNGEFVDLGAERDRKQAMLVLELQLDGERAKSDDVLATINPKYSSMDLWRNAEDTLSLNNAIRRGVVAKGTTLVDYQEQLGEREIDQMPVLTEREIDQMAKEYEHGIKADKGTPGKGELKANAAQKVVYTKRAPEVEAGVEHMTKSYREFQKNREQKQNAEEMKTSHGKRDPAFEQEVLAKKHNASHYTAGDDYGFDERDDDHDLELG